MTVMVVFSGTSCLPRKPGTAQARNMVLINLCSQTEDPAKSINIYDKESYMLIEKIHMIIRDPSLY